MIMRDLRLGVLAALLVLPLSAPAMAEGTVIITQAKALQGGVSPGDGPGYPIELENGVKYRLGSDLAVSADRTAFQCQCSGLEIDLEGFTVSGGGSAKRVIASALQGLTIRNGTITGFKNAAIDSSQYFRSHGIAWTIENVTFTNNGGVALQNGFEEIGDVFEFRNNIVISNGFGIQCGYRCHVEDNIFAKNTGRAIIIGSGTILGNTIIENGTGISLNPEGSQFVGFGNNTISGNTTQIQDVDPPKIVPMQPNACDPAC